MAKITRSGKRKINDFIRRKTFEANKEAQREVPVDSGRLRGSIKVFKSNDEGAWILGSDVDYASIVEFGTTDQEPQPFLRPAMRRLGQ